MCKRRPQLRGSAKARSGFVPVLLLLFVFSIVSGMFMDGVAMAAPGDQMIHNSTNTGSTKWPADGGWGISTGKYGAFDCETCHIKNATNIKRIKSTITTPDTSKGILPGDGQTIIFDRVEGTPGDAGTLGDDTNRPTNQNRICEVCHTYDATSVNGVNVHANSGSSGNHKNANATDCITCHRHNQAFKPLDCNACHGNPPTDATLTSLDGWITGSTTGGKHEKHANATNGTPAGLGYTCDNCHSNSVMPQESTVKPGFWDINIGFSNFGVTTGTYSGQTGISYNNTLGAGGSTCSTVYCHGALDGTDKTPTWTSTSTAACGSCHKNDAASMASSTLGSHARHAGSGAGQLSLACTDCHGTNGSGGAGHVSGTVQYNLTGNSARFGAGATYNSAASGTIANVAPSATYQSCSTVYCHSDIQGVSGTGSPASYASPTWGGGTLACSSCHPDMSGLAGTGSHVTHANTYSMTCANCHTGYTASSTNGSLHANATINVDVAATYGGTYSGGTTPGDNAPGGGYGSCSTVYCHSTAQSSTGGVLAGGDYKAINWGSGSLNCASCHNDMSAAGGSGSHELHASTTGNGQYDCSVCHGAGYSPSTVVTSTHANKTINIAFTGNASGTNYTQSAGTPGDGYGNCSTSACHGSGTMTWGGNTAAVTCEKCHGSAATAALGSFKATSGSTDPADSKVGAHVAHLASTSNLTVDVTCTTCHEVPATVNAAGHMNATTTVNAALGYAAGSCSTTSCHGTSTPLWTDTNYLTGVATHDCAQCHGYPPPVNHTTDNDCHKCHASVAAGNTTIAIVANHINGTIEVTADNCTDCHTSLSGAHTAHTDSAILTGKTLSGGSYGNASWFYNVSYSSGNPKFACGYCHPDTTTNHMKGTVNLDFDPTHAPVGELVKTKNSASPTIAVTSGSSVTCNGLYCHSNGYNNTGYAFTTTPNWYGGSIAGDKCAGCHGNSPNSSIAGSSAHGAHVVGIHYNDVFSGSTGKASATGAAGSGAGHGDPATSTTINCNVCHSDTVTVNTNDSNTVCVTCHTGVGNTKGAVAIVATSIKHINGTPDVVFGGFPVLSKAQVRDDITTVAELNTSWLRNSYKTASSRDASRQIPSYTGGTCSTVDCHNGNSVSWTATNVSCKSCHTSLPK